VQPQLDETFGPRVEFVSIQAAKGDGPSMPEGISSLAPSVSTVNAKTLTVALRS
jgi:hypothetical protein